jgi:hypothetical protein
MYISTLELVGPLDVSDCRLPIQYILLLSDCRLPIQYILLLSDCRLPIQHLLMIQRPEDQQVLR